MRASGIVGDSVEVLFVDKISLSSLLPAWKLGRSLRTLWHFDPLSPSAQRMLRIGRRLGLIRAEVLQVNHHVGQVRDESGANQYVKFLREARAICLRIKREHLADNPLIQALGSLWSTRKVVFYFEKLTEQQISTECMRIGLVAWMLRTQLGIDPARCVLLVRRKQWFSYLEAHARPQGLRLVGYAGYLNSLNRLSFGLFLDFKQSVSTLVKVIKRLEHQLRPSVHRQDFERDAVANRDQTRSTVAIRYWHRKLTFDPAERSEFFWLGASGIPCSEVLLYDFVANKPPTRETLRQVQERGIELWGRGPGIPAWQPTGRMLRVRLLIELKLMAGMFTCLVRHRQVPLYYLRHLASLAWEYAYWYDFYASNRVRINVGTLNTTVGQVLALDALDGISIAYQYSASNILCPTTLLSAGENVQFVFSPVFERLWRSIDPPVDAFVHTGLISDCAVQAVRDLDRVAEKRRQLQASGARFVLCFFDENSLNRWDIPASDDEAADDYEYLLNWLLADPTLGIIFKPKKATTLFQRIAPVSGLIDQANKTGRCNFLMSDTIVGSVFPAEAALIADLCIGKLAGSTAGLEAQLAGVRTVLVDTEGFHDHPLYATGRGRFVFDDWNSLRKAVENYRGAPQLHAEFGDWSSSVEDYDRFRDGQATERMGLYIGWLHELLKNGASPQQAQSVAAERFARQWCAQRGLDPALIADQTVKVA